ncbi:lytic transglycosylase domain-containing protein [Leeia sp. TBRC 13508]|uniref:Lytic transglycosylase domain-containing protein n=1 Tax=Leeia speluncae TaxID=2884804 RepID=A0ABS8D5Q4_9NEIS|nr:lytic transglycosylase domain-containing protein [Leeia speluncae]MCB6183549.1 lytic transglycosylase domain-containing protein [Leeia speluncae]
MKSAVYSTRIPLFGALLLAANLSIAGVPEDLAQAKAAFRAKDVNKLTQLSAKLDGTIFAAYPRYWLLSINMDNNTDEQILSFQKQFSDTPLAERLKSDWLSYLGRRQQWQKLLTNYNGFGTETLDLTCYRTQARLQTEGRIDTAEVKSIWLSGDDQPNSCLDLFSTLQQKNVSIVNDPWLRMRMALRSGRVSKSDNLDAAREANRFLPANEQLNITQLTQIYQSPQKWLDKLDALPSNVAAKETTFFALNRLAMNDPDAAASKWKQIQIGASQDDIRYGWSVVAYWAAYKLSPMADDWFKLTNNQQLSDDQLAWKARAAMRSKDWEMLLSTINAMPAKQASDPSWRYWKARAFAQLGKLDESRDLYAVLSKEYNFYGLLAAEELGQANLDLKDQYKPTENDIKQVSQLPAIQRGLQLYQMDWKTEANREWLLVMRTMDDKQLIAAAELAKRNNWYDRAINTAERTRSLHNFTLRFLSPYREVMKSQTKQVGLDESWVFGLIRQESRFASVAKSVVGAAGLMQLMPTTATWIAKRIGFESYNPKAIHDIETNVLLGTSYLKYVLDSLGHPVLATAAYNAGPGRARAWLGLTPLEGTIYTENIPFDETRDYVKKVMSNAVYYAAVLGDPYVSLKRRMGVMPAKQ